MGAPSSPGLGPLFKQSGYVRILVGNTVSRLGDSIDTVAFAWMVYQLTGSALLMGTLFAVSALPNLLLGFVAGVVADRLPRKPLVVAGHLVRGLSVGAVALLFGLGRLEPWMIFLFGLLNSTAETFAGPASSGLFQRLVPRELYLQASSFSQSAASLAELVGLGVAGALIGLVGIAGAIAVDAATFAFAALMTLSIRVPGDRPEPAEAHPRGALAGFLRDMREGFRFVWSDRLIRLTVGLAAFANFALAPFGALQAAYVKDVLAIGPEGMAWLGMGFSVGIMLGGLALARFGKNANRLALILAGFALIGVFYAALGVPALLAGPVARTAAAVVFSFLCGMSIPLVNATIGAYLMERTPAAFMGRTSAALTMAATCAMPIGSAMSGAVAEFTSIPFLFVAMGGLILAVTAVAAGDPDARRSLREPRAAPDGALPMPSPEAAAR